MATFTSTTGSTSLNMARIIGSDAEWKTPEQLVAEQNVSSATDNEAAEGHVIPTWIGTTPDLKGWPIWATPISGDGKVSFAMCFGRNEFDRDFTYIAIKADQQVIYDVTGAVNVENAPVMRRYNSKDNVPDPLLIADKGAALANAMLGYLVVFFEGFDTAPYQHRIPIITAKISDTTADLSLTGELTPYDPSQDFGNDEDWVYDHENNRIYQMYDDIDGYGWVGVWDLDTGIEITRNRVYGGFVGIYPPYQLLHVTGTQYVICQIASDDQVFQTPCILDCLTGELVFISTDPLNLTFPFWWFAAAPLYGGQQIVLYGWRELVADGPVIALFDVGTGEYEIIVDRVSAAYASEKVVAAETLPDGTTFYFKSFSGPWIYKATVTADGVTFDLVYTLGGTYDGVSLAYDSLAGRVVFQGRLVGPNTYHFIAIEDDGTVVYNVTAPTGYFFRSADADRTNPGFALIYSVNFAGLPIYLVDLSDGSYTDLGFTYTGYGYADIHYDQLTSSKYTIGATGDFLWARDGGSNFTPDTVPLADILALLATRRGYETADIVTEGLSGLALYACYLDREVGVKSLIDQICNVFGVDAFESGDKYKFVKIGRDGSYSVDRTVSADDFAQDQGETPISIIGSEQSDGEVPSVVRIEYLDPDKEFNVTTQEAQRPAGIFDGNPSRPDVTLSAPISITATLAKALAVERAYEYSTARKQYGFTLSPENSDIEPADVLTIPFLGETRDVKVRRCVLREDYFIGIDAEDVLIAVSSAVSAAISTYVPPTVPSKTTLLYWLDGPLLSQVDDAASTKLRLYLMLSGFEQENWSGGKIYVEDQEDPTSTVTPFVGRANHVLAAPAASWSTDYVNTLNIKVVTGTASAIAAKTHAQVMNNANMAYFGKPGRWEIIQWETVTTEVDDSLTLGILQRGRLGSEVYQDEHITGDLFIPVNSEVIKKLIAYTDDFGDDFRCKVLAFGEDASSKPWLYNLITGTPEKPYAPTDIDAVINGADIDLSWSRRSRYRPTIQEGVFTVPLGEVSELYDVEIMSGSTVLRTFSNLTVPEKTYLAADIATDFGSMPAALTYRVYQRSAKVGRGFTGTDTITL